MSKTRRPRPSTERAGISALLGRHRMKVLGLCGTVILALGAKTFTAYFPVDESRLVPVAPSCSFTVHDTMKGPSGDLLPITHNLKVRNLGFKGGHIERIELSAFGVSKVPEFTVQYLDRSPVHFLETREVTARVLVNVTYGEWPPETVWTITFLDEQGQEVHHHPMSLQIEPPAPAEPSGAASIPAEDDETAATSARP